MEHGLGLATEASLLAVVPPLTCQEPERRVRTTGDPTGGARAAERAQGDCITGSAAVAAADAACATAAVHPAEASPSVFVPAAAAAFRTSPTQLLRSHAAMQLAQRAGAHPAQQARPCRPCTA